MKLITIGANQMQLETSEWRIYFSYNTPVVSENLVTGRTIVTEKKWSRTTSRHINKFLDGNTDFDKVPQESFNNLI
jgi:hypothetical protein